MASKKELAELRRAAIKEWADSRDKEPTQHDGWFVIVEPASCGFPAEYFVLGPDYADYPFGDVRPTPDQIDKLVASSN